MNKKLLVISSAPAAMIDGGLLLDIKYCEGMQFYCRAWTGPVYGLLHARNGSFPFCRRFDLSDLPFGVRLIPDGAPPEPEYLDEFDVVMCPGDNHLYLDINRGNDKRSFKIFYNIEYTFGTRVQIIKLDRESSALKKAYSILWSARVERKRRRAFKSCDGVQANGYPAMAAYSRLNRNSMMYLDSRIPGDSLATESEMSLRRTYVRGGNPLRLVHSGRLEPMKGAQDLVPIATRLAGSGIDFQLDVFGTGSLVREITEGVVANKLEDKVRLHGPVDFENELIPFCRTNADLFVSCHRQSDPSCTYLEAMGCGLPIAGYTNEMWRSLLRESGAGWSVPIGDWKSLADQIINISQAPEDLCDRAQKALSFASQHCFEAEFRRRIDHLKAAS